MSYETLPTNLVDDVLNSEVNTQRRFVIKDTATGNIINADVVIEEITTLTTSGSEMGSNLTNKQNRIINQHSEDLIELRRKSGMIKLDLLHPLTTAIGRGGSYTTTQDCWMYGTIGVGSGNATITFTKGNESNIVLSSAGAPSVLPPTFVEAGTKVSIDNSDSRGSVNFYLELPNS